MKLFRGNCGKGRNEFEIRIAYIHFLGNKGRLRLFLGFGKKNKDRTIAKPCAVCSKELARHKYKPSPEWKINRLLCGEWHFEKTRDFTLNAEIEKKKESELKEIQDRTCHVCNKIIDSDA